MARKYDIIDILKDKNQKPFVVIDENHSFTINTSKTTALKLMAIAVDTDKLSDSKTMNNSADARMHSVNMIKSLDKIILIALGEEAFDYIKSLQLTMSAEMVIQHTIMAGISDLTVEEMHETQKK